MRQHGYIFEEDGATWLRTTEFGDDKDRVLIKKMGHIRTSYQTLHITMTKLNVVMIR